MLFYASANIETLFISKKRSKNIYKPHVLDACIGNMRRRVEPIQSNKLYEKKNFYVPLINVIINKEMFKDYKIISRKTPDAAHAPNYVVLHANVCSPISNQLN